MDLSPGARELPVHHLSVRVPWHDTAWDGRICRHPSGNSSCLVLERIREARRDAHEDKLAETSWNELSEDDRPPCLAEGAGFMRNYPLTRTTEHPYAKNTYNTSHQHFLPTPLEMPPFSVSAVPYRWMTKAGAQKVAETYQLGYDQEVEDGVDDVLGFKTSWVQTADNHHILLDSFASAVRAEESLILLYAKATPLVEPIAGKRVLIGAGRVTGLGPLTEYEREGDGELRSMLWERSFTHSIRTGGSNGFLLPYHALLDALPEETDLSPFVAYAPDDHWDEFSYGSELVTHDGAIGSLLAMQAALKAAAGVVAGPWAAMHGWIDERLNELWTMRGPYPGLASGLVAFGILQGTLLAHRLYERVGPNEDPWPVVVAAMRDAAEGGGSIHDLVDTVQARALVRLAEQGSQRFQLLQLLSRFALSGEQAMRLYQPEERRAAGIDLTDEALLANPYSVFEADRYSVEPISVFTVDRGVFPEEVVRATHRLPVAEPPEESTDPRRVRALAAHVLMERAEEGHTLQPAPAVIRAVRQLPLAPPCPLTTDLLPIVAEHLSPVIESVSLGDGSAALQLDVLAGTRVLLSTTVDKRRRGKRHPGELPWRKALDSQLGDLPDDPTEREVEELARQEKTAALAELHAARISVLIGPAGTGKTTLLKVFCAAQDVAGTGVLLLAPTGKARVQLEQATGLPAQTIAQFLLPSGRYVPETGHYRRRPGEQDVSGRTVVIDEASMLTEAQLAATLDALKGPPRVILVGDPRQLPPIGAGRPFVDIVRRLRPRDVEHWPIRVGEGTGYAELTVHRRQTGGTRDDISLSHWFANEPLAASEDDVWGRIAGGATDDTLRLIQWDDEAQLQQRLLEVLVEELDELSGTDDTEGFGKSLGGEHSKGYLYFNDSAATQAAAWQILGPMRSRSYGVSTLNRLLQRQFRAGMLSFARKQRRIPKPVGADEIVYGDKVMALVNDPRRSCWSKQDGTDEAYVANGEIGIVTGRFTKKRSDRRPSQVNVVFSSQPQRRFTYWASDFGERGEVLELAYAITVHKAQGSQFGTVILVLPNPCPLLSPELLYTALTRQEDRVVVLHQGDVGSFKALGAAHLSATAARLTNLFTDPDPITVGEVVLDSNLIHRTSRGEAVRSKSEVIIANALHAAGIDYVYERRLVGADGTPRYPDFTIEDPDTGEVYYWEHLGLLHQPRYRVAWERKVEWYAASGIQEGGGPAGVLLTTRDDAKGGLDSQDIQRRIDAIVAG